MVNEIILKSGHYIPVQEEPYDKAQDVVSLLSYKDIATGSVETIKGNFEIDFSKFPIPLSVRNIPELKHSLYTIVEFVDIDSIKIANFSPRWRFRPISFNRNTSIHLKRFNKKI